MDTAILTQNLSVGAQQDYHLVQSAIAGNQNAYTILMKKHEDWIRIQMLKRANNQIDAEDLTIEAFGKAFRHLSSYVPHSSFSTWLVKIAINNCIDHYRKKRIAYFSLDATNPEEEPLNYVETFKSNALNPEEAIIRTQKLQLVQVLLKKLSNAYREILLLRFYEELSYEEISEQLNLPLGTVKTQIFRGKQSLRALIQKNNVVLFE